MVWRCGRSVALIFASDRMRPSVAQALRCRACPWRAEDGGRCRCVRTALRFISCAVFGRSAKVLRALHSKETGWEHPWARGNCALHLASVKVRRTGTTALQRGVGPPLATTKVAQAVVALRAATMARDPADPVAVPGRRRPEGAERSVHPRAVAAVRDPSRLQR